VHLSTDQRRAVESEKRLVGTRRLHQLRRIGTEALFQIWWRWATKGPRPRLRPEMYYSLDKVPPGVHRWWLSTPWVRKRLTGRRLVYSALVPRPDPSICLLREPPATRIPIMHHLPSVPLGGLFRGTLNFRRKKIASLIELGRADGERLVARLSETF